MRKPAKEWGGVKRLVTVCAKIEDCKFESEKCVIVCVHAHVGLEECLRVCQWNAVLGIVAMPCCNFYSRLVLPNPKHCVAEYFDSGVVSPHRLVRVYLLHSQLEQ